MPPTLSVTSLGAYGQRTQRRSGIGTSLDPCGRQPPIEQGIEDPADFANSVMTSCVLVRRAGD
jgi:hypothetical protein